MSEAQGRLGLNVFKCRKEKKIDINNDVGLDKNFFDHRENSLQRTENTFFVLI